MKSTKKKKINKYDNGSYCAFLTHSTKEEKKNRFCFIFAVFLP